MERTVSSQHVKEAVGGVDHQISCSLVGFKIDQIQHMRVRVGMKHHQIVVHRQEEHARVGVDGDIVQHGWQGS